ncbi:MAG: hypothetical protein GX361_09610 [Bacteroidales bacterium]|nr:hypothetical protein [Bacteroidales bacterium]
MNTKILDTDNTFYNDDRTNKTGESKVYRSIDMGYDFGIKNRDGYKVDKLHLSTTQGYNFNNSFFAGMGVGLNYISAAGRSLLMVPTFVNLKKYLNPSVVTPYVEFRGGYSFLLLKLDDSDTGGIYLSPSFRIRYPITDKIGVTGAFGFVYQQVGDTFIKESIAINGISLRFGVEF